MNHFLIGCDAWWKLDFIWQPAMTSSMDGPRRSSKALSKTKLAPKKKGVMVTAWWSAARSDPLQLCEPQWSHYIWEVCSANLWEALKTATQAAGIGQQKRLNSSPWQHLTVCCIIKAPRLQKLSKLGYKTLSHLPHSSDLLPTCYNFFKHYGNFLQGNMFPQPAEDKEMLCKRIPWIPKHGFLCCRNKQTYFSLAKIVHCNGSYFE